MTIHRCPPVGSDIMPCCGRSPFEVPMDDQLTTDDGQVTCHLTAEVMAVAPDTLIYHLHHESGLLQLFHGLADSTTVSMAPMVGVALGMSPLSDRDDDDRTVPVLALRLGSDQPHDHAVMITIPDEAHARAMAVIFRQVADHLDERYPDDDGDPNAN